MKYYLISFLMLVGPLVYSQENSVTKYLLTSCSNDFGIGTSRLIDPYLSPLAYNGFHLNFVHTERRFFEPENKKISAESKLYGIAGIGLNSPFTASMVYFNARYSWGVNYHFRPMPDLQVLAGANVDALFGSKTISRNVNNPINIDLASGLNLKALARYDIRTRKKKLKLNFDVEIPLAGCMFVPYGGASYFEMFSIGNLNNTFHFSSLHNKTGFNETIYIDIPFNYTRWRFGINNTSLKYKANDLVFVNNSFSAMIGLTFDFYSFRGTKRTAPANFISTNN